MQQKMFILAAAMSVAPALVNAQVSFKIDGRNVQIHSFASQGFMYSNQNNYLSMPTSKGCFAFTDGGANISTLVTDKFRVGAQVYMRNIGELGNARPELDWAFGDYKFTSWFGVRAGKVKTTLGLYNDTQDMDALHTFALLPEAMYPVDWRSSTIAHTGGDVYGDFTVKKLGTFSYTGYAGMRPQDLSSGYINAAKTNAINITDLGGRQAGGDLRLTTSFGVVVGASFLDQDISGEGTIRGGPYKQNTTLDQLSQYYLQYSLRGFKFDAEYRKNLRDINLVVPGAPFKSNVDSRAWYVAGTYRFSKYLEVGAYRSVYYVDKRKDTEPAAAHQFDNVIAARIDPVNHWYMKIEGHFFDGAPITPSASRGFYTASNPSGILPTTNLLVLRTGVSF